MRSSLCVRSIQRVSIPCTPCLIVLVRVHLYYILAAAAAGAAAILFFQSSDHKNDGFRIMFSIAIPAHYIQMYILVAAHTIKGSTRTSTSTMHIHSNMLCICIVEVDVRVDPFIV